MLIRIRRSKDLLLQFQSFECSSLFASNSCVYCTTRSNKCGRIGAKWLFFFTFIEECCVVIEKNIDKKLANRISYQIWYKGCLKGKFGRGVQICEGGSISANGFGPGRSKSAGVSNPLWYQHSRREIRAEILKATPIFAFHESSKPFYKVKFSLKCNSVHFNNFRF